MYKLNIDYSLNTYNQEATLTLRLFSVGEELDTSGPMVFNDTSNAISATEFLNRFTDTYVSLQNDPTLLSNLGLDIADI